MPLQILPATETDAFRQVLVERAAYTPAPANEVLFPSATLAPNILDIRAEDLREELKEPNVVSCKIIDTDIEGDESEQAVAFATW